MIRLVEFVLKTSSDDNTKGKETQRWKKIRSLNWHVHSESSMPEEQVSNNCFWCNIIWTDTQVHASLSLPLIRCVVPWTTSRCCLKMPPTRLKQRKATLLSDLNLPAEIPCLGRSASLEGWRSLGHGNKVVRMATQTCSHAPQAPKLLNRRAVSPQQRNHSMSIRTGPIHGE